VVEERRRREMMRGMIKRWRRGMVVVRGGRRMVEVIVGWYRREVMRVWREVVGRRRRMRAVVEEWRECCRRRREMRRSGWYYRSKAMWRGLDHWREWCSSKKRREKELVEASSSSSSRHYSGRNMRRGVGLWRRRVGEMVRRGEEEEKGQVWWVGRRKRRGVEVMKMRVVVAREQERVIVQATLQR